MVQHFLPISSLVVTFPTPLIPSWSLQDGKQCKTSKQVLWNLRIIVSSLWPWLSFHAFILHYWACTMSWTLETQRWVSWVLSLRRSHSGGRRRQETNNSIIGLCKRAGTWDGMWKLSHVESLSSLCSVFLHSKTEITLPASPGCMQSNETKYWICKVSWKIFSFVLPLILTTFINLCSSYPCLPKKKKNWLRAT